LCQVASYVCTVAFIPSPRVTVSLDDISRRKGAVDGFSLYVTQQSNREHPTKVRRVHYAAGHRINRRVKKNSLYTSTEHPIKCQIRLEHAGGRKHLQ